MCQHFINILLHPGNLAPVVLHIAADYGKGFPKIPFLRLP